MMRHRPVMLVESITTLGAAGGGSFVDATLGLGGHSEAILRASPQTEVIGLDRDAEALELAVRRLAEFGPRFQAVHTDYRRIKQALIDSGVTAVDGVLADLGVSSYQLDTPERGFSFRPSDEEGEATDAPLDMRMDRGEGVTAADLVNSLAERELADLIFEYGEEPAARRIARRIVETRAKSPITTTRQLAELVVSAVHQAGRWRIHPATKTFQALRIAVNRELEGLDRFVADAVDVLKPGGRLVVMTFHSLEDRIIKQAVRYQSGQCLCPPRQPDCRCGAARRVEILTRKPTQPGAEEVANNPRSRSAKLRACRKLDQPPALIDSSAAGR
jgi:16S rRNA (cytosine1402-N4)-methyltransferase